MRARPPQLTVDEAKRLLDGARGKLVLVVGDAILDVYLRGSVARISPEAPVPVVRVDGEQAAAGGAANVAAGVSALGARCRLVAVVGDDEAGERLRELLESREVAAGDLIEASGRPTTRKTRILARHQQMLRVDREDQSGLPHEIEAAVLERAARVLEDADALVIQDYDKGVVSGEIARTLLARARERGIPSIVDPKLRHFFEFRGAEVFKPNARELAAALGLERAPREAAQLRPLLSRLDCSSLLLTLGEDGMLLVSTDESPVRLPPETREVFDVTGAGDTVTAVLAATLMGGGSVVEAACMANFAAGLEVTRLGAVPIAREELLDSLAARRFDR